MPPKPVNGVAVIAVSSLFFGLMAVVTRLLSGEVPAAQVATVRFAIGIVGCALIYAAQRRRPQLTQWRLLVARGGFGGLAVVSYFYAIEKLGPAPATVLNYSSPIYSALFASWFLKESSTPSRKLGLALATAGAALVTLSSAPAGQPFSPNLGALAGVFSALAGGAAITAVRRLRNDTDALTVFFGFCLVGFFVCLPLAVPTWAPMSPRSAWLLLAIGTLAIAGQLLFTWGMGFTTATMGSATTQLVPAVAWALSLGWLGEPVTLLGVLGTLLCVGGVLLGVVPWRDVMQARPKTAP